MKNTLVLGASPNSERYSYKATVSLVKNGYKVFPVGLRKGEIEGLLILTNSPAIKNIDTVTLYVGPQNQHVYYDYILNQIHPRRIVFNPGTENQELQALAEEKGIETEVACTLVLLSLNRF